MRVHLINGPGKGHESEYRLPESNELLVLYPVAGLKYILKYAFEYTVGSTRYYRYLSKEKYNA